MLTAQEVKKIVEELCDGVTSLFPQNKIEAILFVSYARVDAEPESDIDVLILVDASRQDISVRNWENTWLGAMAKKPDTPFMITAQ